MRNLDLIFRKRLNRIREELNAYLDARLVIAEHKLSASVPTSTPAEKKRGGVQEKYLSNMHLNSAKDDYCDADYLAEEADACLDQPRQDVKSSKPQAMMSTPVFAEKASTVQMPVFATASANRPDLDKLLEQKAESFSGMLLRLIDEKDLKDSDVYKRANIDRRLFSKIRGDEDYVPSKKTAIAFCLALQLELEEAKKLLATAGYTLSASSRFDLIIMYLIETKEYNIHFANIVLDDYGEGTLSR